VVQSSSRVKRKKRESQNQSTKRESQNDDDSNQHAKGKQALRLSHKEYPALPVIQMGS
jgi:hypothetical protein